jgi:hypothetical protein
MPVPDGISKASSTSPVRGSTWRNSLSSPSQVACQRSPSTLLGTDVGVAVAVLIPALLIGFFGHVCAIVAFMVIATSGVRDGERGLATGLAALTQQIGCTIGIPILAAVAATPSSLLQGIRSALVVDVLLTLIVVAFVRLGLARPERDAAAANAHDERPRARRMQSATV